MCRRRPSNWNVVFPLISVFPLGSIVVYVQNLMVSVSLVGEGSLSISGEQEVSKGLKERKRSVKCSCGRTDTIEGKSVRG